MKEDYAKQISDLLIERASIIDEYPDYDTRPIDINLRIDNIDWMIKIILDKRNKDKENE